ncbi:MAG: hypothetical protein ACREQA_01045 [Candidatus Binatia bacterium]
MSGLLLTDAEALLTQLAEISTTSADSLARRRDIFNAAAVAIGGSVLPDIASLGHFTSADLNQVRESEAWKAIGKAKDRGFPATVVGVHFIDATVGRFSRIWLPNTICQDPAKVGDDVPQWVYTNLWLRAYWYALRTSTTLINALHSEDTLQLNLPQILFQWEQCNVKDVTDQMATVNLVRAGLNIEELRTLARTFDDVLLRVIREHRREIETVFSGWEDYGHTPSSDEEKVTQWNDLLTRMAEHCVERLGDLCVIARLKEGSRSYREKVISDTQTRQSFAELLRPIVATGSQGTLSNWLLNLSPPDPTVRHTAYWDRLLEGIEAIQSLVFNEPRFCEPSGLLLDRFKLGDDDSYMYLIAGFHETLPSLSRYLSFRDDIETLLKGADKLIGRAAERGGQGTEPTKFRSLVNEIEQSLGKEVLPRSAERRWLFILASLADKAFHEGRDVRFCLGFGTAYAPALKCHLFEEPPPHLSIVPHSEREIENIVQYIKSYFSLFGARERVIWFDKESRLRAVYEYPEGASQSNWRWVGGWGSHARAYHYAVIHGKDRFDIFDSSDRHLIRVLNENVSRPDTGEVIEKQVKTALKHTSVEDTVVAPLAGLLGMVVEQLKRKGHGAGLVVVNRAGKSSKRVQSWRTRIDRQTKSLGPRLQRYETPLIPSRDLSVNHGEKLKSYADKCVPLAELDGAVLIEIKSEGICCRPAQHFSPYIRKSSKGDFELLDLYKLAEKGKKIAKNDAQKVQSQLLEKFVHEKDLTHVEEMELLAASICGMPHSVSADDGGTASFDTMVSDLAFLNSAGTRHHSLWGISVTAEEPCFVLSLSQDGKVTVFWDGRVVRG